MPHPSDPDTSQCPLCGQPNGCAIAAGRAPESCWCMAQTIDRAALARLPADQRERACICPACGAPAAADSVAAPGVPPSPPI
ncbi:cysteine-rich CWC family protein [Acidovorax sp. Leaf78]|uniref:cysteine-rich CWC family protein n=1 Tax=Acidovorax sp. Leaf78 TaxID=1736237 RepID=UPI0009E7CD5F|nr:cysteine-rich CWC family protein [Acidovorax sp. Leaf78]